MKHKYISADELDRREEAEQERYAELFELHYNRLVREYYEDGGSGDYHPHGMEVHVAVTQQMELEKKQKEQDSI